MQRLASPDLGRIFRGDTVSGLSEWQLLERYLEQRDESAFEALVSRHGPMVLGVCRRMLGDSADVDDAFQATFLVLVRRARQLGPRDAIGPWLYGVAARVAPGRGSQAARHRRYETIALEFPVVATVSTRRWIPDLVEVLDQELSRLPSQVSFSAGPLLPARAGRTRRRPGTSTGRSERSRAGWPGRGSCSGPGSPAAGLAPTAGALASFLAPPTTVTLERPLIERTVSSSLKLAAGQSVTSSRFRFDHLAR